MTKYMILSVALLVGCQAADNDGQMEEAAPVIPSLSEHAPAAADQWNASWSAGDAQAVGNHYADDATLYPPGAESISGRSAITDFWAGGLAVSTNGGIESKSAESDGAIGYETGTYVMEDSTGAHVDHGKFLVVWKYVNGEWKIQHDMWNSDMAPEGN